jgi:predicted phosphate transport protein (TIGR00153 family)
MPLLREDIYKLVECIDTVANAAEKCCDFFLNQRPSIPKNMKPAFLDAIRKSLGVGESLKNAVLCYVKGECSIDVARHHAMTIGVKETEVDKIEWDLTKEIFTSSLEYSHKLHLRLCLESITEVSDLAEDAADRLELVTLKSMV